MSEKYDPWKTYEPQPPRCHAIVVTEENYDEVCAYFANEYHHDLVSVTKHVDRTDGGKSLTLKFVTHEITVKPYQVIRRSVETEGRYGVMDYRDFNNAWRERLSK